MGFFKTGRFIYGAAGYVLVVGSLLLWSEISFIFFFTGCAMILVLQLVSIMRRMEDHLEAIRYADYQSQRTDYGRQSKLNDMLIALGLLDPPANNQTSR